MKSKPQAVSKEPGPLRWPLWSTFVCCLFGGGLAWYATKLTLKATKFGLANPAGCSINDWLSCDTVLASTYATLLGIPTAWWGFLFYLGLASATLFAALTKNIGRARATTAAGFILSLGAVLFSFYKVYHLWVLKVLCPVCAGMHVLNLVIALLLVRALRLSYLGVGNFLVQYMKGLFGRAHNLHFSPQPVVFGALVLSLFSLGNITFEKYNQTTQLRTAIQEALDAHFAQPAISLKIDSSAPLWGNPDAKITLVEFSDFECPHCQFTAFHLRGLLLQFREDVRLHFMNYPLDKSINGYVQRTIHPHAGLAARAGVCAKKQGDFWSYHDDLFRNQKQINRKLLIELAKKRGWDVAEFNACLDSEPTLRQVRLEIAQAGNAKLTNTPTIILTGRIVKFPKSSDFIRAVIREERRRIRANTA